MLRNLTLYSPHQTSIIILYMVYWLIGHRVLAYFKKLQQRTSLFGIFDFLKSIFRLLAKTKQKLALKQQQNTLSGKNNFIGKCKYRGWRCQIIFIYGSTLRSLWPWPCTHDSIFGPEIIIGSDFILGPTPPWYWGNKGV